MYLEKIIEVLQGYWAVRGCCVLQPLDQSVGAGTFHPATFLRACDSTPWSAVYVQPSRRPADGRYGKNPNRLQHYYQLQVVQKPSPADFQDAYLASLSKLGIKHTQHDIRFIEDDWESPSLGAWGLGWEIWLDGMEITQFTYFQEIGGKVCRPVMGEITYGIERIAMYLQDCDNVYNLHWNKNLTYGELFKVQEYDQSVYNFELADTDYLRKHFDHCETTGAKLIDRESPLVMPAYEMFLSCSHSFNLLDSRRVISVTERTGYVQRLRKMSTQIATCYAEPNKAK